MTFTDDDLKRLKESTKYPDWPDGVNIDALLARLEAAEKVSIFHFDSPLDCQCEHCIAWRAAKGER